MATIQNRSRFRVSVQNSPKRARHFPYNRMEEVKAYVAELRVEGLKPHVDQLAESFEVKVRQQGYAPMCATFSSREEAERFVEKVEEERSRGLFIDYTQSHKVTFADLLVRYLAEEVPKLPRSKGLLLCKIEGWLEDSGPRGVELLERYRDQLQSQGQRVRAGTFKMREVSTCVLWVHKRLTEVKSTDIEDYIAERLLSVMPSTVDRELDIIRSVFTVATKVWDFNLAKNPMDGARRPEYFNERDRRLVGDEEERLFAAARAGDREAALEQLLSALAEKAMQGMTFTSSSARKKVLASERKRLLPLAKQECEPVGLLEAFVQFQLMTAARRSETLSLTWEHVDFEAQTAFLPITKNGRSRKLPLRSDLLDMLERLPRVGDRVFPITTDFLAGAWQRICAAAGITNLHIHDLRHEAVSRVAELGDGTSGSGFGLIELQAYSGHRDLRSLLRYAHLCASRMASRLDDAFAKAPLRKGRRRLDKNSDVRLAEILVETAEDAVDAGPRTARSATPTLSLLNTINSSGPTVVAEAVVAGETTPAEAAGQRTSNVVPFPVRRRVA